MHSDKVTLQDNFYFISVKLRHILDIRQRLKLTSAFISEMYAIHACDWHGDCKFTLPIKILLVGCREL